MISDGLYNANEGNKFIAYDVFAFVWRRNFPLILIYLVVLSIYPNQYQPNIFLLVV